jgi:hypothetical protein
LQVTEDTGIAKIIWGSISSMLNTDDELNLATRAMFAGSLNLLEVIGVLKINCIGFLMLGLMKMLLNVVEAMLLKT